MVAFDTALVIKCHSVGAMKANEFRGTSLSHDY